MSFFANSAVDTGTRFSLPRRTAEMSASNTPEPADIPAEESERAGWEGSDVSQAEIDWLVRTKRIPAQVICRIPGTEAEPDLQANERVVFVVHFERGFGLPASPFFRACLNKFHLQPHHLPTNGAPRAAAGPAQLRHALRFFALHRRRNSGEFFA